MFRVLENPSLALQKTKDVRSVDYLYITVPTNQVYGTIAMAKLYAFLNCKTAVI